MIKLDAVSGIVISTGGSGGGGGSSSVNWHNQVLFGQESKQKPKADRQNNKKIIQNRLNRKKQIQTKQKLGKGIKRNRKGVKYLEKGDKKWTVKSEKWEGRFGTTTSLEWSYLIFTLCRSIINSTHERNTLVTWECCQFTCLHCLHCHKKSKFLFFWK